MLQHFLLTREVFLLLLGASFLPSSNRGLLASQSLFCFLLLEALNGKLFPPASRTKKAFSSWVKNKDINLPLLPLREWRYLLRKCKCRYSPGTKCWRIEVIQSPATEHFSSVFCSDSGCYDSFHTGHSSLRLPFCHRE